MSQLYQMAHKYDVQALMTACRLYIMRDLRSSNLVSYAILGHLCKDDKLKKAALSMMGREPGPMSELKDYALLEKHVSLSLEIADQMKKERDREKGEAERQQRECAQMRTTMLTRSSSLLHTYQPNYQWLVEQ